MLFPKAPFHFILIERYFHNFFQDKVNTNTRTAATSKMERFVMIVNSWKPLTIITKRSILDVATILDPTLSIHKSYSSYGKHFLFIIHKFISW